MQGRPEVYVLEAKSKKAKEEFAAELRKVIIRQKEHREEQEEIQSCLAFQSHFCIIYCGFKLEF